MTDVSSFGVFASLKLLADSVGWSVVPGAPTGSTPLSHCSSRNSSDNVILVEYRSRHARAPEGESVAGNRIRVLHDATIVAPDVQQGVVLYGDVYDHFAWRYMVKMHGEKAADQSLKTDPDEWQSKYFDDEGNIKVAQLRFWLSAVV